MSKGKKEKEKRRERKKESKKQTLYFRVTRGEVGGQMGQTGDGD